ncbi:MAG: sulfite exporter TauE/SafE family protein [Gammaproteobacteria bacterium]|nr:sulfite exporter TauE/SafE family protein [Gammaproteobacteria bacterium]
MPLLQLDWSLFAIVVSIMIFAGLVHGTLGLGFPMVATPMLAISFDVRTAILITLLPTVAVNLMSIWHSRDSVGEAYRFLPLIGFALLGSLAGAYLLANTDPDPFRLALAGLILFHLWNSQSGKLSFRGMAKHSFAAMVAFGLTAGLSGGSTNVMVAILIAFFLSLEVPRATMVPALNGCFLAGKLSQIVVFSMTGLVSLELLAETSPLAVAAVMALLVGQRLRENIEVKVYTQMLQLLLALLAIVLIVQFIF